MSNSNVKDNDNKPLSTFTKLLRLAMKRNDLQRVKVQVTANRYASMGLFRLKLRSMR